MSWKGQLSLHYSRDGERTIALDRHSGPLRVLRRLYPEGPGICHHVLVHPPGGIVGGDVLEVHATLDSGTHAVITTPGATRFYRSDGAAAEQHARLRLASGARLEWLPLETIAHPGCIASNRIELQLGAGAEAMGWDILALGLPAANDAWTTGRFLQHLELEAHWLERGLVEASDTQLLDSPLGWAGRRVLATLWLTSGSDLPTVRRDALLDAARACITDSALAGTAGATSPNPRVLVLRVLAERVEPAMTLLVGVRAAWRRAAWDLGAEPPRIWRM